MQTIILKHVQVFVVMTFEIFQIFFLDRGVGGWGQLYPNFFWIFGFFLYLQGPLIRSRLDYCCQLWSPSKKGDVQALEQLQR